MKKILIICVNYNSYDALYEYLESVDSAAAQACNDCKVHVLIADNSTQKQSVSTNVYAHIECSYFSCENDGYIGTAEKLLARDNWEEAKQADYLIISNVDICLSDDTFKQLCEVESSDIAWVVPRIYTSSRGTEENPQAIHRYSKTKLYLLYYIFSYPILYYTYARIARFLRTRHRNHQASHACSSQEIYAGSGAIFIFTKEFISKIAPFHYPCFLYGEELFFAEHVRINNMKTIFSPNIYIENRTPNISTKTLGNKTKNKYCATAMQYILRTFY